MAMDAELHAPLCRLRADRHPPQVPLPRAAQGLVESFTSLGTACIEVQYSTPVGRALWDLLGVRASCEIEVVTRVGTTAGVPVQSGLQGPQTTGRIDVLEGNEND
jgi:hypothetical protein